MAGADGVRDTSSVRVLLLASGVNSLTQRVMVDLSDAGYDIMVSAVSNQVEIQAAFDRTQPDVVVAPYLKKAIPECIWSVRPCLIVHPGVRGDRGPSSLDWAIHDGENRWGVTVLQANGDFDAGDVWAHDDFVVRPASKSALYRHEVADAASQSVQRALLRYRQGNFRPCPLDYSSPDIRGRARAAMKQSDRSLVWSASSEDITRKLRCSDGNPGVADEIGGEQCYLFGAHQDDYLNGPPGKIIAKRHGAICRATGDGAVWIERLKRAEPASLKLPAGMVLAADLGHVPELPVLPHEHRWGRTYRDIRYEEQQEVGYLYFEFYNGAMSTEQCRRLQAAFRWARQRPTKAIALMGGADLWSNGLDLTVIEAAPDPARESWRNINAMDDLVRDIITTNSHLTCAAVAGNAGAGGAILALAADLVFCRAGIVLNPHYRTMHLYGSEYWTYLLPRRVGAAMAHELTERCQPLSAQTAKSIGLIDDALPGPLLDFRNSVRARLEALTSGTDYLDRLRRKRQQRQCDEESKPLEAYRHQELAHMQRDFTHPAYHEARRRFLSVSPRMQTSAPETRARSLVAS